MTLLEKCRAEHPELDEEKIISWMCPCDFGYEKMEDGCNAAAGDYEKKTCWECWNRQADAAGEGCHSEALRAEESRAGSDIPGDPSLTLRMTAREVRGDGV